ncbi:MAG: D-alanyl-D-alanine carboxypeptidase [Actinobacteria bacterium]|nr:D-alanyl-D-alanine carboxypeptidase [Actinomycetota bacterium]
MRGLRRRQAIGALVALLVLAGPASLSDLAGAASGGGLPPPTPVGPDASLSPFVTSLRTPVDPTEIPEVSAPSAILADLDTGQILFAKSPNRPRPIASLTKIMTALLVLRRASWGDLVTVSARAAAPGNSDGLSELGLVEGERVTVGELTWALLVQSANDAAVALAEHVSGTVGRFVGLMNDQARRLGMTRTAFRSPSGLDDRGRSTARDLLVLTRAAFAQDPRFADIVGARFHDVPSPEGEPRHIQNRNVLLWLYPGATGVKTGYTSGAGYCVVATAEAGGRKLIAVVLGDAGEPFSDAATLLDYGFAAFAQERLVEAGESLGLVRIRGGSVPVQAGEGLSALAPKAALSEVAHTIVVDPAAAFPPAAGDQVGILRISIPGRVLGSVPLVVSRVPAPPPVDDRSWWDRAGGSVAVAVSGLLRAFLD